MKKKLNIAVIGTGYLGKFHTEKYSKLSSVHLVGVVDVDKKCADAIAHQYQTRSFSHYKEILTKVDAVSIAVPTDHHYDIAKECLEAGVDVLIEKSVERLRKRLRVARKK